MIFQCKRQVLTGFFLLLISSTALAENCNKVGVMAEFTRDSKTFLRILGQEVYRGASLAVDQINKKNNTPCFELIPIDTNNAHANIPALIDQHAKEGISLFVGLTTTSTSIIASDALQKNRALLFSPASPRKNKNAPRIINFTPSGILIFQAILNKYNIDSLTFIDTDNHHMFKEFSEHFREMYEKKSDKHTATFVINPNGQLSSSDIEKIKQLKPSHIFLSMTAINTAKIMLDLQKEDVDTTFILPLAWTDYPFDETNSSIKFVKDSGLHAITPILYKTNTDNPLNINFVKEFNRKFHRNPTSAEGDSFDAIFLMNTMLNVCGKEKMLTTPETCLQQSLPFESLRGPITHADDLLLTREIFPMEVTL